MYYPSEIRKEGRNIYICVLDCVLFSFLINRAPRRKEKNCMVLKCSLYSVFYIVQWQYRATYCVGQTWTTLVTEKGVMQKYLPADAGGCLAEALLLWQKAANAEGVHKNGFVSGRWSPFHSYSVCRNSTSTLHPCKRWRRKHQEFPSFWVSQSLICSRGWKKKGTSSKWQLCRGIEPCPTSPVHLHKT